MTHIVLLNGPPRVGKDTASRLISMSSNQEMATIGFSYHLKRMVHAIYLGYTGWLLDPNYFDASKGEEQLFLAGIPDGPTWKGNTWRGAYIHYSENVIKPIHGKEWFGEMFVRAVEEARKGLIVVPDSGFREEAERTVREFGAENVRLVRIHRAGHDFIGDSRSYIDLTDLGVACFDATNITGDKHHLSGSLVKTLGDWL